MGPSHIINSVAFADDLILCANTEKGLEGLLLRTQNFMADCGLIMNTSKCLTISLKVQPKQKTCIIADRVFKLGDQKLPALKRTDSWKYLGIYFSPEGRSTVEFSDTLNIKLARVTKAPLKPQQRLHILRTVLIP